MKYSNCTRIIKYSTGNWRYFGNYMCKCTLCCCVFSSSCFLRNKDEITLPLLRNCFIFILPSPQSPLTDNELNVLKTFITEGGRLLVLLAEDDRSNVNIILEEFGITPNMGRFWQKDRKMRVFVLFQCCRFINKNSLL